jgi:biofilm PGA synthesis N-glycosyltransferase PgaC
MKKVSVGICAYNEESSIERVVSNVLCQPLPYDSDLTEVLIVASGCTDRTEDIVRKISLRNRKVRLISEESKRGKASAINQILREATGDIIVMTDADVLPASGSLMELIKPFRDQAVGAVGGRPIPSNEGNTFWGFLAHLIWTRMQDELLKSETQQGIFFQLSGYLCAIRARLIDHIPYTTIDDDKYMGQAIRRKGYGVLYEPSAVVYIHGPTSTRDFLVQRVRVLTGHQQVKKWFKLKEISTSSAFRTFPAFIHSVNFLRPKEVVWAVLAVTLESGARLLATYNFMTGRIPFNWQEVPTTKQAHC